MKGNHSTADYEIFTHLRKIANLTHYKLGCQILTQGGKGTLD